MSSETAATAKAIEESQLALSTQEQEILFDVLLCPPEPNAALLEAARDFTDTVKR